MWKIIVCIAVIISCNSDKGPKIKYEPGSVSIDPTKVSVKIETAGEIFPAYIDSMNDVNSTMPLPSFLFNYLLDYEHPWVTDHGTRSLRKMIFDSTTNASLIRRILESDDIRLRSVINLDSVADKKLLSMLPYSNISTYQMAKQRLEVLTKNN